MSGTSVTIHPTEGAAFSGTVVTFTDADPADAVSDYAAMINWGYGHTTTVRASGSAGVFTVAGTNTYAEEGSFPVTVTISDVGGASATVASSANVSDAPLSGTSVTWVTVLYNNILSRAPSSTELNYWVAELNNGISRTQVVQSFVGSPEYRGDVIQGFYEEFLNRAASSGDVNYYEANWVNQLSLQQAISTSTEYLDNPPAVSAGTVYKWQ